MRLRRAAAALGLYAAAAWLWLAHGASFTGQIFGLGPDPGALIWCLAYLPWAFAHHHFAPVTHLLWQPYGLNLAWVTAVPLLGLLMAPLTATAGPVLSYNLLALAAPALAGWTAYFLCLELCARPAPALLGGFLFAFSSYEAAQSLDHLNLAFTALVPLMLLVALRRLRGRAGRWPTALQLGLLLGGEFLISEEILATSCLFGAIAFLLAYAGEKPRRPALRALALDITFAAPLALLLAAPVLFAMLQGLHEVAHPASWASFFSIDALNFLVPTAATMPGGRFFAPLSHHFSAAQDEQTGYLGLPVILLLIALLRDAPTRKKLWLPLTMLGLTLLAALGPELHVAGRWLGMPLPWALIARLPLLGAALPARCMLYAFLALAIIVSLWLAENPGQRRRLAVLIICLSLLPAEHPAQPAPFSAFFRPGRVQQLLGPDPTLLILPFSINGPSSFWQTENKFGFSQIGGYLGFPPGWALGDPAVPELFSGDLGAKFAQDLARLCQSRGAKYVIAGPGTPPAQRAALASLHWSAQKIDDVTIYTVPQAGAGTP